MEKVFNGKISKLGFTEKVCDIFPCWEDVKDEILIPERKNGSGNGTIHIFIGSADSNLQQEFASYYEAVINGEDPEIGAVEITHYFLPNNIISMLGYLCKYYYDKGEDYSSFVNSILSSLKNSNDESGLLKTCSLLKLSTGANKLRPYFKKFTSEGLFPNVIRPILLPNSSYKISLYKNDEGEYAAFWLLGFSYLSEEEACSKPKDINISSKSDEVSQTIYFGAPGTGKSYKIENEILNGVPDTSKIRVTFYPDYYYSDFIGGLRPKKAGSDIAYEFTAGPFAEALLKSFTEPTYIIIEEINRGNPAAIFGDIFQLLDRRDDGRSRYETTNEDLYKYLTDKNPDLKTVLKDKKVFLPADLHILCTMNTADQNVFVLDTAFKRRFSMEYVPIDMGVFDTDPKLAHSKAEGYPAFTGTEDLADLIGETDIGITEPKRNWPTFASFVNAKIDEINSSETKISEDKKLGPFFAVIADFNDRKKFADKVLYYLKQDVFKYEDTILTDSYEKLYTDFVMNGKDVFSIFQQGN